MGFLYRGPSVPLENLCAPAPSDARNGPSVPSDGSRAGAPDHRIGSARMLDVVLLALGLTFFVLSVGYAVACDKL